MDNEFSSIFDSENSDGLLPNGHKRSDYYDLGYTDKDIEFWGLNQPGAPDPHVAGFEILDAMDGDYDGEIDF